MTLLIGMKTGFGKPGGQKAVITSERENGKLFESSLAGGFLDLAQCR